MFSSVVFPIGSCPDFSRSVLGGAGAPHGHLWAGPLWDPPGCCGTGSCGTPWAIMGRAHVGTLGPHGPGPCEPPWAHVGRALVGPLGPHGPGPCGPPWALMGQTQMGPLMQHSEKKLGNPQLLISFRSYRQGNAICICTCAKKNPLCISLSFSIFSLPRNYLIFSLTTFPPRNGSLRADSTGYIFTWHYSICIPISARPDQRWSYPYSALFNLCTLTMHSGQ